MNIIFQINGGLGKSVMATSVCKSIKIKYPESKLILITAYPDVFLNNPNVDKCFRHNELKYFYKDYVENQDFLFFGQDPYMTNEHIKKEKHLIQTWCEMFDLPFVQNHGEFFLTSREIQFYSRKHSFKKPILVLQTSGSAGDIAYNWTRDISPTTSSVIIDAFKDQYSIVHVRNENQISYNDTNSFTDNIRAVAVMIQLSDKRILMDSCCQHIAAAFNLPSNVLWVTTDPKVFGYDLHNNIVAQPETSSISLKDSFLTKYELIGNISDFPYNNESEIFESKLLVQSLI